MSTSEGPGDKQSSSPDGIGCLLLLFYGGPFVVTVLVIVLLLLAGATGEDIFWLSVIFRGGKFP